MKDGSISTYGLIAVYIIIAIFSLLNYWSVKLLTSFTSLISVFKLGVPILTIIMLLVSGFDTGNYGHSIGTFMPYGSAPILLQQQHLELSSHLMHSRQLLTWDQRLKSEKNIARGIVISLTLSAILYIVYKVRSLHLCQAQCCMSMDGAVSISIHHLQIWQFY